MFLYSFKVFIASNSTIQDPHCSELIVDTPFKKVVCMHECLSNETYLLVLLCFRALSGSSLSLRTFRSQRILQAGVLIINFLIESPGDFQARVV